MNITDTTEIDLNGHTISATLSSPLFKVSGGKLTLKGNGTISNVGNIGTASNDGEIVVENGTYSSSESDVFRAGVNGTITINGGTLTGLEGAVTCYGKVANGSGCHGTITINGGVLEGLDGFAIGTNATAGMGENTITINGGTLIGNVDTNGHEAVGVYIPNNDTFVMNDGAIIAHGGTGLCMRAGDVTINGGSITANGVDKNGNAVADGTIGDDNTVMTGVSAVIYHESADYPGKEGMKLTVTGGTFTGIDHAIQVLSNEAEPQVFVTGGTFTPTYPEQ